MVTKLKSFYKNRILFSKILLSKLIEISPNKIYSYESGARSESENGIYLKGINYILKKPKRFLKFKRNMYYLPVLEHVTFEQGQQYFKILKNRNDSFFEKAIKYSRLVDCLGKPVKHIYDEALQPLSPTTLRYLKVASDLNLLFGNDFQNVIEIGCGYGGQCLTNDYMLNFKCQTLVDLPLVNQLIKRYLESFVMSGSYRTKTLNQLSQEKYDLVISNYAFSELPANLQKKFLYKILKQSERGYLTMNSGLGGKLDTNKLSLKDLQTEIPKSIVLAEQPETYEYNYILVWGHSDKNLSQFKLVNR